MASLKNVRHEKFAQCVASGLSGADAYRQAAEYSGKQADGNAANWMKRPGVRERIEELKAESSARCSLSREAYIRSLVEMYEAKPRDASMDNPRCDVLITRGQKHAVFPQKLAVGAQLSKLVGWDRPTEVRLEAGTELAAFLGGLFAGGGTLGGSNQRREDGDNGERSKETSSPASGAGVDTEAGAGGFPGSRLATGAALLDPHTRRVGNQVCAAPAAGSDHRPDLPARLQADHHPQSEAAWLLDALGRHLRGPALLRVGPADFADDQTMRTPGRSFAIS